MLQIKGQKIYKFGFGQSPFPPPTHVIDALKNSVTRTEYTPVQGLPKLRTHVADFHSIMDGYEIDSSQISIASGSKQHLFNIISAFNDAVILIPSPAWVSYAPQAKLANQKIHLLQTEYLSRWRIDASYLDETAKIYKNQAKLLILNYPGNPCGLTYDKKQLNQIASIAKKHEMWVISDEIYGPLHHTESHISLATLYPERTIVTTGLSKWCGVGGWRLGVQILPKEAPKKLKDALIGIASETYSCAPVPIQVAACEAYKYTDTIQNHISMQCHILSVIGQTICNKLKNTGLLVHSPQGGFYLMLDFSSLKDRFRQLGINNDINLCTRLLDDINVALLPGSAFGVPSSALTTRMAYVDFDGERIIQVFEKSPKDILTGCKHMMEGVEELCKWISTI